MIVKFNYKMKFGIVAIKKSPKYNQMVAKFLIFST
jgi:hypothetical protein